MRTFRELDLEKYCGIWPYLGATDLLHTLPMMGTVSSCLPPVMQWKSPASPWDHPDKANYCSDSVACNAGARGTTGSPVAIAQAEGTSAQQDTAAAVPTGASSASQPGVAGTGAQVPAQAGQAASAGYSAQQCAVDTGSSASTQGSQGGSSAQGAQYTGATVPAQQSVARTGGVAAMMASASAAKAAQQPVQGQPAQSPAVSTSFRLKCLHNAHLENSASGQRVCIVELACLACQHKPWVIQGKCSMETQYSPQSRGVPRVSVQGKSRMRPSLRLAA